MNVYSKQEVKEMNEDEFVREIILPILKGQGWQEIQNWHGRQELGKDVVGWRKNPEIGYLEALAVVAKATPTRSTNEIGAVSTQITQALKRSFRTRTTQKELSVDHVWIVVNKPLAKETRDNIESGISLPHSKLVILDLDQCWELARPYILASKRDVLQLSQDTLKSFDSPYDLQIVTTDHSQTLTVRERYPGQSQDVPLEGRVVFSFDDPSRADALSEYLKRVEETGEAESLPDGIQARIEADGIDEIAAQLFGNLAVDGGFQMGSAKSQVKSRIAIRVEPVEGPSVELPHIEMNIVARGTKQARLTNFEQDTPIRIEMLVQFTGNMVFNFTTRIGEASAQWVFLGVRLLKAISERAVVTVTNVDTGIISHQMCIVIPPADPGIPHALVEEARVLAALEARTGKVIVIPKRQITNSEAHTLEMLRSIVDDGYVEATVDAFELKFLLNRRELDSLLDEIKARAVAGSFGIRQEEAVTIFGTTLPLGRSATLMPSADLINEDEIRAQMQHLDEDADEVVTLKFQCVDGTDVRREYIDWIDGRMLAE